MEYRGLPTRRWIRAAARWLPRFQHPAQFVVAGFASAIAVGTVLLSLPVAREGPASASFLDALFTATSGVCVTGLIVVDTPGYWSTFGEVVILGLIQVGGFGLMTTASLLVLLVSRRIGLRSRLTAAAETKSLGLGDVRRVVTGVAKVSVLFEFATALILTVRLLIGYDEPLGRAAYLGVFHAISAFNNAGFSLYSDSLMRFATDPWVLIPIAVAVICGGLGFPVLLELRREFRQPRRWSLHTKITLSATALLIPGGMAFITYSEWDNDATLAPLSVPAKLLNGFFHSVMPRTAGFNSVDVEQMTEGTWLGTDVLMFIGGGSASTAGGIKVTTFFLLLFVIVAEIRGQRAVNVFDRQVGARVQRQALTVALLSVAAVVIPTIIVAEATPEISTDRAMFEVISAFSTVGLSTGITDSLPGAEQAMLVLLMFVGRLGPITFASALALRNQEKLYDLPEGRPIIG
ncbi:TrkH family potassium uptake protein [Phytoactinopolyspora halotolerans]|uniref:TrkH family potassium uptake protein n=1 Tax=Phytoactinopolyspora halotolerans TaxID=1981512 RepID=UPI0035E40735